MSALDHDPLFTGLTRPQMFMGVPYSYFVANAIVTTELFLILRSPWVMAIALAVHIVGVVSCIKEPRFFDLWLVRVQCCPRVRNFGIWGCNSYRA